MPREPAPCFSSPALGLVPSLPPSRRPHSPWRRSSVLRKRVVGIAIQPPLLALRGGDDGMPARARVLRGVAVGRAGAAQRSTTLLAGAREGPPPAPPHSPRGAPPFLVSPPWRPPAFGGGCAGRALSPPSLRQ